MLLSQPILIIVLTQALDKYDVHCKMFFSERAESAALAGMPIRTARFDGSGRSSAPASCWCICASVFIALLRCCCRCNNCMGGHAGLCANTLKPRSRRNPRSACLAVGRVEANHKTRRCRVTWLRRATVPLLTIFVGRPRSWCADAAFTSASAAL